MFQATIENTIKRAKNTDTAMVESVVEVRGPGNTFIIVETFAKNVKMALYGVQVLKSCLLLFRYCGPLVILPFPLIRHTSYKYVLFSLRES